MIKGPFDGRLAEPKSQMISHPFASIFVQNEYYTKGVWTMIIKVDKILWNTLNRVKKLKILQISLIGI